MKLGNGVISELSRGRAGNMGTSSRRSISGLLCPTANAPIELKARSFAEARSMMDPFNRFLKVLGIGSIQKKIVLGVIAPAGRSEASIPYPRWFQGRKHVP
jgi:hypothetical protein